MESDDRKRVIAALRAVDACSVENGETCIGYPDVEYIGGTMELKHVKQWPKGEFESVKVPKYTKEQRVWAQRRIYRGGTNLFLLRGPGLWLLMDGGWAATHIGEVCVETIKAASLWWCSKFDPDGLLEAVERGVEY